MGRSVSGRVALDAAAIHHCLSIDHDSFITRLRDQSSAQSILHKRVIRVAVQPTLAGFRRCYDRVFTRAGVFRDLFNSIDRTDVNTGFVGHCSLRQKRQWTKNFLSSVFISAGRCSMSQCPVSLNVIEVTLLPIIRFVR